MLLITCPWCGERQHTEFNYGGDATVMRPDSDDSDSQWLAYIYLRDNPRGLHTEYWHHVQGCRRWLRVVRNTLTHDIDRVDDAGTFEREPPCRG
jgi:heterotetrameric sarcosine oxidase delta subunit